jgi:hypothetical protein
MKLKENKIQQKWKGNFFLKNEDQNEKKIWEITIKGKNWKKNTFIKGIRTK